MSAVKQSLHALADQPLVRKVVGKAKSSDIIDIRGDKVEINLKEEVNSLLNPAEGPRRLPTLLLYDEKGLQLFEDITYLDEYYLTNHEIQVLKDSAADIASVIPAGAMVIELGSGNLRKTCLLLQAFEDAGKPIDYYALDLSREELERTLDEVPEYRHVSCHGLWGTYDDGREWLKQPSIVARPKSILHLGSSIGNFQRDEAAEFLEGFAGVLQPTDSMLVGVDSCTDPDKVYHAYNDKDGVTHSFILNGLEHANQIYGEEIFHIPDWRVIGEYVYDDEGGRHQAFLSPVREITVLGSVIKPHERIQIEQSLKYTRVGSDRLWKLAGLEATDRWTLGDAYGLHMLKRATMSFSQTPAIYAGTPLPTVKDWEGLWAAWDAVTTGMLPHEELTDKPIKLRNACIFYLGHIPTFLDIQLTKTTDSGPTDPASYNKIFERGIDPDVDNPEHCHDHSDIPEEWPPLAEILAYQDRVRARLRGVYAAGQEKIPRSVGRAIWLGFEHEIMHLETLLYMLLQSDKTLPPPGTEIPDFAAMARKARDARVANEWFDVPAQTVTLGMDDPEDGTDPNVHFGWDNEKPARQVKVHAFQAQGRAITNEEYAEYLYTSKTDKLPASWSTETATALTNGHANGVNGTAHPVPDTFLEGKSVRTVYGLVPLKYALDWPVFASYDELAGCALWMGGRIPTFEEAKSIYAYVDQQKRDVAMNKLTNKVPAVNGHLVNDGVEETPPSTALAVDASSPAAPELFVDLTGTNVGFSRWHPVPVTSRGGALAGQADMGGAWEWTSSVLAAHDGFAPMPLYPAYTADFFDGKHNVVLGGSWATHPRIAGRKSFVNWYQRNYPYAWVGARLVRDV